MSTLIVGCGYLGLGVARQLRRLQPENQVFGTTRSPGRFEEIAHAGAVPVLADVLDENSLRALPEADLIVHCVSFGRGRAPSAPSPQIVAMEHVLSELARRNWSGRLVYVSTTSVYGQTDGSWVDEDSPAEPTSQGGQTALAVESLMRSGATGSFEAVTIRMAGLYGRGRLIQRSVVQHGELIGGNPERWLNLIHVEDAANATVAALQVAEPFPLYLGCDNQPIKRATYYSSLAELLKAPVPRWNRLTDGDGEPDKRVCNRRMREHLGVSLRYPDIFVGLQGSL